MALHWGGFIMINRLGVFKLSRYQAKAHTSSVTVAPRPPRLSLVAAVVAAAGPERPPEWPCGRVR